MPAGKKAKKRAGTALDPPTTRLLEALRASREPLAALVSAWLDDVLARPVADLFDSAELAAAIATGIRGVAADPRNEEWLRKQMEESVSELQRVKVRGKLKSKLPKRAVKALRGLAAQPFVLDEDLIAELIDHPAAYALLRVVLEQSLLGFAKHVTELFPGGRMVTGVVRRARGLAAGSVGGVSHVLEDRVNQSVEEALAPSVDLAAERMADDDFADDMADWRGHVIDVLLDQPVKDLVGSLEQIEAEDLAAELAAFLRGVAEWDKLEDTLETAITAALDRAGKQSVRELMSGTSMEKDWRPALEKQLVEAAWPFVQSDAFAGWLSSLSDSAS